MSYLFKYYAGIYDRFMEYFNLDSNEVILSYMNEIEGKRILDIGGGTGTLADILQRRGADVTLIDPSKEMTKEARKKNNQITIYNKPLEELENLLKKGVYDKVILRDALHHMESPKKVIALSHTYLKEGGEILIWEFNAERSIAKLIWCFEMLCFERCHRFSKHKLRSLCKPYFEEVCLVSASSFEMLYKGKKR